MYLQLLELIEKMSLYCGEGTSDKVYHISYTLYL